MTTPRDDSREPKCVFVVTGDIVERLDADFGFIVCQDRDELEFFLSEEFYGALDALEDTRDGSVTLSIEIKFMVPPDDEQDMWTEIE